MKGASSRGRGFVTRVDDIIVFEDSIAGFDATFEDSGAAQTSASLRNRPLRGRPEDGRGLGVFVGSLYVREHSRRLSSFLMPLNSRNFFFIFAAPLHV